MGRTPIPYRAFCVSNNGFVLIFVKMSKNRVEILQMEDAKKAARTLYEAFDNDDVARYVSRHLEGNPELKKQVDLQLYEGYVRSHIMKSICFVIKGEDHENKDTFETVSIWVKPDAGSLDDYLTLVRSGFAKMAWNTGAEGRRRVFGVLFPVLHDNYDHIMSVDPNASNTWTLVYLGSTPAARGKGNVRAMFDHVFDNYIDPMGANAYLESSAIRNLPIYERFGFRAINAVWLGDRDDPVDKARMDIMIRGPRGEKWRYLEETREKDGYIVPEVSIAK